MNLLFISILIILLAPKYPLVAWLLLGFLVSRMFIFHIKIDWRELFSRPIKKLPKGFTITQVELSKPMDYIYKTYPGKSDPELLRIREEEMIVHLKAMTKSQYGKKGVYTDHFEIDSYYSFGNPKKLIVRMKPKSWFGNACLGMVMEAHFEKGDYFLEDEEDSITAHLK